jgi:hypothetical protein
MRWMPAILPWELPKALPTEAFQRQFYLKFYIEKLICFHFNLSFEVLPATMQLESGRW